MHIKVVFETYPWLRAINMLKKGQADAISYMGKSVEREDFAYF
jgi:polar amino acid transport system substrate-binding protein